MAGIGATLREAREQAHLDIVDFESRTKIRAKYLRALEDEEWSLLPGYTFTKGFLRTYADMLGLDGRALVDEFKRQYRDPSELDAPAHSTAARRAAAADSRRSRERPREQGGERGGRTRQQQRPSRPPIIVAVVVLVILLVGALYAVGVLLPRDKKPRTTTTSTTHTHTTQTTASHSTATHTHATHRRLVALKLLPKASVYVCLVGYPGASNRHPHIRLNGVILVPHQIEPVRHDNHFHITVGNGSIVLLVNNHRHPLSGSNPASYNVTLQGRLVPLRPSQVPHCG